VTRLVLAREPRLVPASRAGRASAAGATDPHPTLIARPAGPVTAARQQPAGVA
jgi:hypothetical protein